MVHVSFLYGIMDAKADKDDIRETVLQIARAARQASLQLSGFSRKKKDAFLRGLAARIRAGADRLAEENRRDLEAGRADGLTAALLDRLTLTPERIEGMAKGVEEVAALEDPVGAELERVVRPNGLEIVKVRVPIGVIGIIYESRPNVTVDCAALCFKSGNAAILRGGKEAFYSNAALAAIIAAELREHGLPEAAVQLVPTTDRAALTELLKLDEYIHCIIPRGGEGLIRFVAENSRIPVIKHYKGVCSLYIHDDADKDMAIGLVVNAKCQRPGVCNAIENLWLHTGAVSRFGSELAKALIGRGVELRGDKRAVELLSGHGVAVNVATEEDFHTEYLDKILTVGIVDSPSEAIDRINTYGSGHSDGIVTSDESVASSFIAGVDSATVYWNASTRFTDGYEFGLGAEIGISTDRLHARGPMGLRELCTYKFVIYGTGQERK